MFTVYSVHFVLITKTRVDNSISWNTETFLEELKNIREHELFCEHCGMPFQAVTVVTKLLVSLA